VSSKRKPATSSRPRARARRITTAGELSRATGTTERTARRWIAAGLPRQSDGSFDLAAVVQWVRDRRERANESDGAPEAALVVGLGGRSRANPERVLNMKLRNMLLAEELKQIRGTTIDRAEVVTMLVGRMKEFSRLGKVMERRLGQMLKGAVHDAGTIEAAVRDAFEGSVLRPAYGRDEKDEPIKDDTKDAAPPNNELPDPPQSPTTQSPT
jgi:hypothetical protein